MFDIELGENGDILCSGRLDAAQCGKAQEFMDSISGSSVLDFSQLEYISSAGLGILLKTQKRLVEGGASLELRVTPKSRQVRSPNGTRVIP